MGVFEDIRNANKTYWQNNQLRPYDEVYPTLRFSREDVDDAAARLQRFAPLLMRLFPETIPSGGIIESPLRPIPRAKAALAKAPFPGNASISCHEEITGNDVIPCHVHISGNLQIPGDVLLKCDSHLAIAGSVKARGGIYEVLKQSEEIAVAEGLLPENLDEADYSILADCREVFAGYTVQVGSTGNLGMSIGIMSAALGYKAIVHMSADAKQWKKDLLRLHGVDVREYTSDYSVAVAEGRKLSDSDPRSYFVDDEHSSALFLGYAVAGRRLHRQLDELGITIDEKRPLIVYLPCGVGGAPGGIAFGLKNEFGDDVHCFFVEPVQSPCMLVSMASGEGDKVCVADYGLTGLTQADGLAVGRASGLVCEMMEHTLSGISTVDDDSLFDYMRLLKENEDIVIEPSSCAAFEAYVAMGDETRGKGYMDKLMLSGDVNPVHVMWATGGSLMPAEIIEEYLNYGRR